VSPRPTVPAPTIVEALGDPHLLGGLAAFRDLGTWRRWLVFLTALLGHPLDPEEIGIFQRHTGRSRYAPPPGGYQTAVAVVGRQSGKTQIAAALAAWEAVTAPRDPGRTGQYALMVAQDFRGALRALFSYAAGMFDAVPLLRGTVVGRTTDTLTLRSGVVVAAYPCRPPAIRGLRARIAVLDELGFYRNAEGNPQDLEMLRAVRPTLATTGGRLVILSSPAGQSGALWDLYRGHFARDEAPVLVWRGSAPEMNPTLPADYLARMEQDDPEGYRSEVLGEFRAGVTSLFDPEMLEACVTRGVRERLPEDGVLYQAAADPSGGRRDAFTVAIGHQVGDRLVVDVVRDWAAPFNPSTVVAEAADLCHRYRVHTLVGDNFGAEWIVEPFRQHGLTYRGEALDRSRLYLELLPIVNAQALALPDLPPLLRELRGLERRRGLSGRDRIVPSPHEHDDRAVSVAGLAAGFLVRGQRGFEGWRPSGPELARPVPQVEVIEPAWYACPNGCGWQDGAPVDPAACPSCRPAGPSWRRVVWGF
jgi:hypothetical protein